MKGEATLSEAELLALYKGMVGTRVFDERMVNLQRQGRIGFYGPIRGQEASTIGSGYALAPDDCIFPALREGALAHMRGLPLSAMVAQLMGNAADRCKGRQMPCHYSLREGGYVAMSSVIGTQLSHAVGWAMAAKYREDPRIAMAYLGDGATSEPEFHYSLNFAQVYAAPVVFFCQNNHWSITVPVSLQTASESIAVKAEAYGMEHHRIDGNDVLEVHATVRRAAAKARAGGGPTFIESVTYRMLGHTTSDDPARYRDPAEVEPWKAKDPIDRFRRHLEGLKLWDSAAEDALLIELKAAIQEAVQANEELGPPALETIFEDVFAEPTRQLAEQEAELLQARRMKD